MDFRSPINALVFVIVLIVLIVVVFEALDRV